MSQLSRLLHLSYPSKWKFDLLKPQRLSRISSFSFSTITADRASFNFQTPDSSNGDIPVFCSSPSNLCESNEYSQAAESTFDEVKNTLLLLTKKIELLLDKEMKKRYSLSREQQHVDEAEKLQWRAELIMANIDSVPRGASTIEVDDWYVLKANGEPTRSTIVFDTNFASPREEAEAAFKLARRRRNGREQVKSLINACEARKLELKNLLDMVEHAPRDDEVCSDLLNLASGLGIEMCSVKRIKATSLPPGSKKRPKRPGRRFVSPEGVPILVGRNSAENERLSLVIAKPPDLWMHVAGAPGAHVILQLSEHSTLCKASKESIQLAANLACFYSGVRGERSAQVTVASPSNVYKPKWLPLGAIMIRQELRSITGFPNDVPEECMIAATNVEERVSVSDEDHISESTVEE